MHTARPKRRRPHIGPNNREQRQAAKLADAVSDFEEFRNGLLKAIRVDVKNKMSPKHLREKYAAILQGRMITDALTTEDVKEATAIAKDVIDRVEGKATERKEVTHKFKDLSDQELKSILESEEADLKEMERKFDQ